MAAHLFGTAKAMISSLVMSDPVRLPPVLTTVTNCLPSAPKIFPSMDFLIGRAAAMARQATWAF